MILVHKLTGQWDAVRKHMASQLCGFHFTGGEKALDVGTIYCYVQVHLFKATWYVGS